MLPPFKKTTFSVGWGGVLQPSSVELELELGGWGGGWGGGATKVNNIS